MFVVVIAFAIGPASDPFDTEPSPAGPDAAVQEAATDAPAPVSTSAGIVIDLDDESTWAALTPEQKDELRAKRAERDYQRQQLASPSPAPQETADEAAEMREARLIAAESRRERSSNREAAEAYDASLRGATIATGVIAGLASLLSVVFYVKATREISELPDCVDDGFGSACPATVKKATNWALGSYVMAGIAAPSGVAAIVCGSLLGAHRQRQVYMTLAPTGVGLRF
jgi:hypothetical protein